MSVGPDSVVAIKTDGGDISFPTIKEVAEQCGLLSEGETTDVNGLRVRSFQDNKFVWSKLHSVQVHRPDKGKRCFKLTTQYGRVLIITEDHSVYRVFPSGEKSWVNGSKKFCPEIVCPEIECVQGSELKQGDFLLLDNSSFEFQSVGKVDLYHICSRVREYRNGRVPFVLNMDGVEGLPVKVRKIEEVPAPDLVYDFSVVGANNFIANGLLVHNSGTPLERSDNSNLKVIAMFGEVIKRVTNKRMMEDGVIPPTTIHFAKVGGRIKMWPGHNFHDIYNEGIVHYQSRNDKIIQYTQEAFEEGKRILIVFKSREHGEILSDLLWCKPDKNDEATFIPHKVIIEEPIPHERIDGRDSLDKRQEVLSKFEDGVIRVLLASGIFGVGLDLPYVDMMINAAGSKDPIPVKQRLGRPLRGTGHVDIIEFLDGQHRILAEHSMSRLKIFEEEDCFEIKEKE